MYSRSELSCKLQLFSFVVCVVFCKLRGQSYPRYDSPLDIKIIPSGLFGELRGSHFHAGIDIKTQQKSGLRVYAVSDGYISRIKVSPFGYGKTLYLTHPDGYTSVYAHLKEFSPEMQSYTKRLQYYKKTFALDERLPKDKFVVKKRQPIALSGNTGRSQAPHLHFEIRNTKTQTPQNPQLFGIEISDDIAPVIRGIYAYPLGENSHVNSSENVVQINLRRQKNNTLLADKIYAVNAIGLGISVYDRQNYSYNKTGIYMVSVSVNGLTVLSYDFKKIPFEKMEFVKTLIDYKHYIRKKQYVQKCFISGANKLDIYTTKVNNGIINVKSGMSYNVQISVRDIIGNTTKIHIPIEGKNTITERKKDGNTDTKLSKHLIADRDYFFSFKKSTVYFPPNCFFENVDLRLEEDLKNNFVGTGIKTIPLRKKYSISFDISDYDDITKQQLFVVDYDSKETSYSYKKGDLIICKPKSPGRFTIAQDSIPPKIKIKNFKDNQWVSKNQLLKFEISDSESGIKSYEGRVNGKWILMEYEPKNALIFCDISDLKFKSLKKNVSITVTDNVGNTSSLNTTVYKK